MKRSLMLLSPLMLTLATGAKGCKPKDQQDVVVDDVIEIAPPSVTLQVAGIEPAYGTANQSFSAEILGSGFARGAQVQIGSSLLNGVSFVGESVLDLAIPPLPVGRYDVTVINPDGKRATLRNGLTLQDAAPPAGPPCPSVTVYFDFDSYTVKPEGRAQLDSFAACVRNADAQVRVEGHCDERGTTEYNLALGQRRADAVNRYMTGLGVPKTRVQAVSYGEERPASMGSGDDAWAKNRRAEISASR